MHVAAERQTSCAISPTITLLFFPSVKRSMRSVYDLLPITSVCVLCGRGRVCVLCTPVRVCLCAPVHPRMFPFACCLCLPCVSVSVCVCVRACVHVCVVQLCLTVSLISGDPVYKR